MDIYEGFIAKHSLVGGRITTRVVDPAGFLLGVVDSVGEPQLSTLSQTYLWPGFPRDIFAPGVPIPPSFTPLPKDPSEISVKITEQIYGNAAIAVGTPWGGEWFFTVGCPTDDYGIGASLAMSNLQVPATGQNYATILNTAQFGVSFMLFTARRGTVSRPPIDRLRIAVYENALPGGLRMAPRMVPTSTSGGSGLPLSVRMPRQIAVPSCVRDRGRCFGLFTVTESPVRTAFEYACGDTGVVLTFFTIFYDTGQSLENAYATTSEMLGPVVQVELWDDEKPWRQEFVTTEEVSWFNPDLGSTETIEVEISHRVIYPVGGNYLEAGVPFQGYMPNNIGLPVAVMFDDRVEFYSDYRVTRTWVDERDDIYPGLTPLTMQTQTGIFRVTVPYTINEGEQTAQVGAMSNTLLVSDISGAAENGSFEELGGDREDYHRLYRVRWAGNVGGRAVVIASMIKHKRWETPPENPLPEGGPILSDLGAAVIRQTAQSGINLGHSVRWTYSYETPNGAIVNGNKTWSLGNTVKIPGDDGDGLEWQDAVGVVMLVDGVATEWDAKALGWCLLRNTTAQLVREDDWRWETVTQKWAVAISDTEIALCAYSFPYVPGVTTCKLLKINVVSGAITLLRTDDIPSTTARPAITCYQRRIVKDDKAVEPCLIYRLGSQTQAGWMDLSKDGGDTWTRIWDGPATPGMGAFYVGSPVWTPEYGEVFRPYM